MKNKEKENRIEEIKEELERIERMSDYDEEEYDDYIDEVYDAETLVKTYGASRILKAVDEIAYNIGKTEYWENKKYDLEEELKEMEK